VNRILSHILNTQFDKNKKTTHLRAMKRLTYMSAIIAVVILAFGCQSPNSNADVEATPPLSVAVSNLPAPLAKALEAHGGLDRWNKMNTLRFTIQKEEKLEKQQIDLKSRKVRIDTDDYTLGFDGKDVWVTPDLAAFGKGSARFYHNLIFYFFGLPYLAADPGINYEVLPDYELNGRYYDAVKISYDAGVGDAPDDEYIMHFDKETGIMHLLLYTVTYYSKEKGDKFNAIIFDDWIDVEGMKLPGSFKGFKYNDGKLGEQRYERKFIDHYLSKEALVETTFAKPSNAEVSPLN